jgi:hypothetical protein
MIAWDKAHPASQLDPLVAAWRLEHPDGTLEDLVRDLDLWVRPGDTDAQRLAWYSLKRLEDPAAMQGFPAMHKAGQDVPAVRGTASRRSSPRGDAATDCAAGTPPRPRPAGQQETGPEPERPQGWCR